MVHRSSIWFRKHGGSRGRRSQHQWTSIYIFAEAWEVKYCSKGNTALFKFDMSCFVNQTFDIFIAFHCLKKNINFLPLHCKENVNFRNFKVWNIGAMYAESVVVRDLRPFKVSLPAWWPCPWCWTQLAPLSTCCTSSKQACLILTAREESVAFNFTFLWQFVELLLENRHITCLTLTKIWMNYWL